MSRRTCERLKKTKKQKKQLFHLVKFCNKLKLPPFSLRLNIYCRDGAVVRALASQQCGGAICELSLLLVLALLQGFFSRFSTKTNISRFLFDQDRGPT